VLESVADLQVQLNELGFGLLVCSGKPEDVFGALLPSSPPAPAATTTSKQQQQHQHIYFQTEVTSEEKRVERAITRRSAAPTTLHTIWGRTLYHIDDLPFTMAEMQPISTKFRNAVEQPGVPVRPPLPTLRKSDVRCAFVDKNLHSRSVIEFHTVALLEASRRVTNGIPLGFPLSYRFSSSSHCKLRLNTEGTRVESERPRPIGCNCIQQRQQDRVRLVHIIPVHGIVGNHSPCIQHRCH
jgi:hypothetical protein